MVNFERIVASPHLTAIATSVTVHNLPHLNSHRWDGRDSCEPYGQSAKTCNNNNTFAIVVHIIYYVWSNLEK